MRRKNDRNRFTNTLVTRLLLTVGLGFVVSGLSPVLSPSPLAFAAFEKDLNDAPRKVEPQFKTPPKGSRLNVVTDKLTYDARTQIATAVGRVVITYGKYVLIATKVVYDKKNDRMRAVGSVHLREPGGNILQADIAQLENKFRDGFARHLRLLLTNDSTLTADYAKRRDGYLTVYQHVTYTRCKKCTLANGSPLWQIRSAEVTHNEKEGVIYHKDSTFQFLGADVFWLPEFSHPDPTVKRRTGFLVPEFGFSSTYGLGVGTPYFINLADNYDITLRPFFTTKQGPLARATWRHRLKNGQYSIDAAGIYQLNKKLDPPGNRRFRGFVRTKGDFKINRRWSYGWDATLFSDETFGRRYDIDKRVEVVNRAHLTGISGRNFFSAEALQFEGLLGSDANKTYPRTLPFLRYSLLFDKPIFGGQLGLDTNIYSLHRDTPFSIDPTSNQADDQTRAIIEAHWNRRLVSSSGAVVTPFARLRGDLYFNDKLPGSTKQNNVVARLLPTAGVDLRWPMVKSGDNGQQVITPVFQLITAPNESKTSKIGNEDAVSLNLDYSNIFLTNRFSGNDRFEGGTRANVGLMYSWMFNNGGFLRASAGQSYHLAGRNSFTKGSGLTGDYSDIVMALALQPNAYWNLSYQARIDDRTFKIRSHEASLKGNFGLVSGAVNYVNIAAAPAYGRPLRQEQIWGDASIALTDHWNLFGSARYDLRLNRSYSHLVGIGYNCDCFGFKVYYKDTNAGDRDAKGSRSIFMSVEFKTLGSAKVGSGF